ncbi:hypothetical protein H6G89_29820 [Oscillatoria sp. FACHB-1407]|uniref:hypothetical protein n=1 Tax=Oscillatoria sp. FACHB-1407 TaxID=2692847 RepID=UPI001687BCB3|nr:hypothetical protein [Oscillatoria sp. FACHB-1407]MBD2465211.1 hypothetical protein [Oscillatoria sp. FACHB-1407]
MQVRLSMTVPTDRPLLESASTPLAAEAEVILGRSLSDSILPIPLAPSASSMFGPRGVCLVAEAGPLWVADTGHHRLLGWRSRPTSDNQAADWVIGQPDFAQEGQNGKGAIGAATVSVPTGICATERGLIVADAWNHRVLIWHTRPEAHNVPADVVLGQTDFWHGEPNRGDSETAGDRLHWCYGVFYYQGKLFVADTGNRRVLVWNQLPQENGQPADLVLGQPNFTSRNENGGGSPTAASLRWAHGITVWNGNLVVADAGNNRMMIWQGIPTDNNTPCVAVLGQENFQDAELNRGVYAPTAASLNMPYGVTATEDWLLVADTANSRLLGWKYRADLRSLHGTPADALVGQFNFHSKGENRSYGMPLRDSVCWSYDIQACGNTVAIADSGNNRVLLWRLK